MISDIIHKLSFDKSFPYAFQVAYECPFLHNLCYHHSHIDFYFSDGSYIAFSKEYIPSHMNFSNKETSDKIQERFYKSHISVLHQNVIEKHDKQAEVMLSEAMGLWLRCIK